MADADQDIRTANLPTDREAVEKRIGDHIRGKQKSVVQPRADDAPTEPPRRDPAQETAQPPSGDAGDSGEGDPQTVPLDRFSQVVSQRKEAQAEAERLRRELDEVKRQAEGKDLGERVQKRVGKVLGDRAEEDLGLGREDVATAALEAAREVVDTQFGEMSDDLRAVATERRIQRELGDTPLTAKQLAAVAEISAAANLSAQDAYLLAQAKAPTLFSPADEAGFDVSTHATTRPGGASPARAQKSPEQNRQSEIASLREQLRTGTIERETYNAKMFSLKTGYANPR